MKQVKNMIHDNLVNEELCDYMKSLIRRMDLRYNAVINYVYNRGEHDDSPQSNEKMCFYASKLKSLSNFVRRYATQ